MLERSGIRKADIDGLTVSSYTLQPDHSASLAEYLGLSPRFAVDIPFGGASGVIAMRRAARAIQNGDAEVVACLAADVAPTGDDIGANFSRFARDHVYPYGAGGANSVFAMITDRYMRAHGVTREDFGQLCLGQRQNGLHFPYSLYKEPLSMSAYLASRQIAPPIHLFDCVRRCCGAEGFLVMDVERAESLKLPFAILMGAVERHNGTFDQTVQTASLSLDDANELYRQAGIGPGDVHFVQAYDDYPVIVMMQLESLGFCGPGQASGLLKNESMAHEGSLPLNTHGGMLCMGQAGAAGGFCGTTEALRQLTGERLGKLVPKASIGVVSCYGTVNYDRGICASAAVLGTGARA
ncbi:MAG: thiolase family protein [Pigmentiphaga sp.]